MMRVHCKMLALRWLQALRFAICAALEPTAISEVKLVQLNAIPLFRVEFRRQLLDLFSQIHFISLLLLLLNPPILLSLFVFATSVGTSILKVGRACWSAACLWSSTGLNGLIYILLFYHLLVLRLMEDGEMPNSKAQANPTAHHAASDYPASQVSSSFVLTFKAPE